MSTELVEASAAETALVEASRADLGDADDLVIPILKVGQALTREVVEKSAAAGDFINGLTGESLGDQIEFVVASFIKGRFATDDEGNVRHAFGREVPWDDDPLKGQPFTEHPDAEEKYRERVNAGEIPWGKGPPISTTYNFTGYVVGQDIPVRLSLMRTAVPTARKWVTILRFQPSNWAVVYDLTTDQRENRNKQPFYVPTVRQGRKAEAVEQENAKQLAAAIVQQAATFAGEDTLAETESPPPATDDDSLGM
jgi:hypothetical protein